MGKKHVHKERKRKNIITQSITLVDKKALVYLCVFENIDTVSPSQLVQYDAEKNRLGSASAYDAHSSPGPMQTDVAFVCRRRYREDLKQASGATIVPCLCTLEDYYWTP